jgi:hypothetical protein
MGQAELSFRFAAYIHRTWHTDISNVAVASAAVRLPTSRIWSLPTCRLADLPSHTRIPPPPRPTSVKSQSKLRPQVSARSVPTQPRLVQAGQSFG